MRRILCLLVALACTGSAAHAAPRIGPGVLVDGCTSNFVFRDATELYLGLAAHCVEDLQGAVNDPDEPLETHECAAPTYPVGAEIEIEGASAPGRLAYSSWGTMRAIGEKDREVCMNNDFALVRVDPRDHAAVDPSIPVWGGPVGLRRAPVQTGETALSFGRSDLRQNVEALMPREGYFIDYYDAWTHTAWFMTPAVFGDSGSAVLDGAGGAVGALVTLEYEPPGSNGIIDLVTALEYMHAHGGPDAHLVNGTAPFAGANVPTLVESPVSEPDPAPRPAPPASAPQPAQPAPPAGSPPASAPARKPRQARRKPSRRCRTKRERRAKRCRAAAKRRARARR